MFVDRVVIEVQGGRGGDGCVSFRREKHVPKGGPDGGDGGDGGNVVLVADPEANSLVDLVHRQHWRAQRGTSGSGANCHGRRGADLLIRVPPGTVVRDLRGGYVLKDLARGGDCLIAARGGKGGYGNRHFKSSTNRAPRQSTPGQPGEHRMLELELKLIADVGIIGKPNAGKSTLLSRISRARPKVAAYPFTTKVPHLGLVLVGQDRSFVAADIPGLVEGAHAGSGLGLEFLRHIERTRVLVHLVEPSPADLSDPMANYHAIRAELAQYNPRLCEVPEITVISKAELPTADAVVERFQQELGPSVFGISAVTGKGLDRLLRDVLTALDTLR